MLSQKSYTCLNHHLWWILALIISLFSPTTQSLWVDEGTTTVSAMQTSFVDFWNTLNQFGSDNQLILYYICQWIWQKIAHPTTEWGIRSLNILFIFLSAFAFRKYPKALIFLLLSPFFFYYGGEVRPYILIIAASSFCTVLFFRSAQGQTINLHAFFASAFFLCCSGLTSVIWCLGYLCAFLLLNYKSFFTKRVLIPLISWTPPFLALGGYYLYSLLAGYRAVAIDSFWGLNLGCALYEILGLTGLGPSRYEVRTDFQVIYNYPWIWILGGCIVLISLIIAFFTWKKKSTKLAPYALCLQLGIPMLFFCGMSAFCSFRFSGRHFAASLPIWCFLLSYLLDSPITKKGIICTLLLLCTWLYSDIQLKFNPRYERENYRAIAQWALQQTKEQGVLIQCYAEPTTLSFYGWVNPQTTDQPDYIIISRPEQFAPHTLNKKFKKEYGIGVPFYQGFKLYKRQSKHQN